MTRFDKRNLKEAIRACIAEYQEGHFRAAQVASMVMERYPDVVGEAAKRLMLESLTSLTRRMMKEPPPLEDRRQLALFLPAELASLRLASAFSLLPAEVETEAEEVDEEQFVWVPFKKATLNDLVQHLRLLDQGIERDQRRRNDVFTLYDYVRPLMEGREDEPFAPVLRSIAEKQQAGRQPIAA